MKKKIIIFSGSRADYGILRPLLSSLKKKRNFNTKFLVNSHHYNKKYGLTIKQIIADKIKIDHIFNNFQKNTSLKSLVKFGSKSFIDFFKYIIKEKPNLVIVLGDRYEVFFFSLCAYLAGVNICHLHGGDVTNGSFDEGFRHSISKFSKLHFVVHKNYKKRLINLGENPNFIFDFGSISVAQIMEKTIFENKKKLYKRYKISNNKKVILVTIHSETARSKNFLKKLNQVYSALNELKEYFYIFTLNNQDPLGDQMYAKLTKFKKKNSSNTLIIKSMGSKLYYDFLKNVDLVMGNSSSGIIEAPSLKTPTLNLGERQNGRVFAPSIFHSNFRKKNIKSKIKNIFSTRVKYRSIFYKRNTIKRMIKEINNFLKIKEYNKEFYDKR